LVSLDASTLENREDGVTIDLELPSQLVGLGPSPVLCDQLVDLYGIQSILILPGSSNFGPFWTLGGHFEQGLDAFSLVRVNA